MAVRFESYDNSLSILLPTVRLSHPYRFYHIVHLFSFLKPPYLKTPIKTQNYQFSITSNSTLPTNSQLHTYPNAPAPSVTSLDWGYSSKILGLSMISTMFESQCFGFAKIANFPQSYCHSLKIVINAKKVRPPS